MGAGSKEKGQGSLKRPVMRQDPQSHRWLPTRGQTFDP